MKDGWGYVYLRAGFNIFAALRIHVMKPEKKEKRNSLYFIVGEIKIRCQERIWSWRGQGL